MDFARGRLGGGLTIKFDAQQSLTPGLDGVVNEMRLAWPDRKIDTAIEIEEPIRCDRSKLCQFSLLDLLGENGVELPVLYSEHLTGDGLCKARSMPAGRIRHLQTVVGRIYHLLTKEAAYGPNLHHMDDFRAARNLKK